LSSLLRNQIFSATVVRQYAVKAGLDLGVSLAM
jgi:hypothetical protein